MKGDTGTASFADFLGQDGDNVRSMGCITSLAWDTPFGKQGSLRKRTIGIQGVCHIPVYIMETC